MATAAPQEEAREKECMVCNELFTTPKILPCGHILCRHCLIAWLKTQPEAKCPSCRYPILDKSLSPQENVADVIDSFPTQMFLAAMVEADRLLSKQHVCCVCEDEAAVSLCLNCSDMFCQVCSRVHKKQSATKHHQVEELSTLTADVLVTKRSTTCAAHANEVAQVYCPTHSVSVCILCATTDHCHCPHVVKLETRLEESQALLTEVKTTLKSGLDSLDEAIGDMEKDIQEVDRQTEAGVADVKAVRQRLEKAVQDYCQRLEDRVLRASSDLKSQMADGKASLQKQRGRFAMHSHIVEQAERLSTHGSFSDMMAMMKTRVSSLDCRPDFLTSVKVNRKLTLTIDPLAVTDVEKKLSQIGALSVEDTVKLPDLRFHENHGKNIRLSNDGQTAEKVDLTTEDGIVISRDPMMVEKLYEVCIDAVDNQWSGTFTGIVTSHPDTFKVPHTCLFKGLDTVVYVAHSEGRAFDQLVCIDAVDNQWSGTFTGIVTSHPDTFKVPHTCLFKGLDTVVYVAHSEGRAFDQLLTKKWPALYQVPVGTQVGLALDSGRSLHLYVNGQSQGIITTNIPDPCYFMFDLWSRCLKVTALPVRPAPGL